MGFDHHLLIYPDAPKESAKNIIWIDCLMDMKFGQRVRIGVCLNFRATPPKSIVYHHLPERSLHFWGGIPHFEANAHYSIVAYLYPIHIMYFHYSHLYIAIKPLLPWYCWSMMVTYFQIFHFVTFFNPYISPYIIKSIRITSIPRKIPIFLGFKPCFCHSLPTPSTRKLDRQGDPSDGPLPQPYIEVAVPGYSPVTWLGTGKSPLSTEMKKAGNGKIMENHLFLWWFFF